MKPVHGDGKGFMGLLGYGAVGHRSGLKAFHDLLHTFHFGKGDSFLREVKVKETS